MIINDILLFVRDRAGESDQTYVIRQINNVIRRTWLQTDLPGSLFDMVVEPTAERIMILPWYVNQIKGVRRAAATEVTLYQPQAFYVANGTVQYSGQWSELGTTPLIADYNNLGRLRVRLKRPATSVFSVTISGAGDFGAEQTETLNFAIGDIEQTTTTVFNTVASFGKSAAQETDAYMYDIAGTHIATLPSRLTDVRNKRVRVLDQCAIYADLGTCYRFGVLFKRTPPTFTSPNETLEDALGLIIQDLVTADILAKSDGDSAARRMQFHGKSGMKLINDNIKANTEGKLIPLDLTRDPFTHEFYGHL